MRSLVHVSLKPIRLCSNQNYYLNNKPCTTPLIFQNIICGPSGLSTDYIDLQLGCNKPRAQFDFSVAVCSERIPGARSRRSLLPLLDITRGADSVGQTHKLCFHSKIDTVKHQLH